MQAGGPPRATQDVGTVTTDLLADRRSTGRTTIDLPGPEDLSFDDMALMMSDALGTSVWYRQVQFDEFANQLRGFGMPEAYVAALVEMLRAKNNGTNNLPSRVEAPQTPNAFRRWSEKILVPAG